MSAAQAELLIGFSVGFILAILLAYAFNRWGR